MVHLLRLFTWVTVFLLLCANTCKKHLTSRWWSKLLMMKSTFTDQSSSLKEQKVQSKWALTMSRTSSRLDLIQKKHLYSLTLTTSKSYTLTSSKFKSTSISIKSKAYLDLISQITLESLLFHLFRQLHASQTHSHIFMANVQIFLVLFQQQ